MGKPDDDDDPPDGPVGDPQEYADPDAKPGEKVKVPKAIATMMDIGVCLNCDYRSTTRSYQATAEAMVDHYVHAHAVTPPRVS